MRFVRGFKLEQFCLHIIVENLDRYISCPSIPQRPIDFLLRVYSEEIFKRYSQINTVTEEFLLWFLNPHSKKIILPLVTEKITKQLQFIGPTITSLDLQKSTATESMMNSIILSVPNVTHLNVSGTGCSDNTLLCIQKSCQVLISLELSDCKCITSDGVMDFCRISLPLKNLNLMRTRMDRWALSSVLNKMPQIESLKYYNFAELFYVMKRLSLLQHTKYSLTELVYEEDSFGYDPAIIIDTWACLCPDVKKVYLRLAVSRKALEMCSRFQHIEDLEIYNLPSWFYDKDEEYSFRNPVNDSDMTLYQGSILPPLMPIASRLTSLKLTDAFISIQLLLEKFYNLKVLGLRRVSFAYINDNVVLKENCLETLAIEWAFLLEFNTQKAIELLLSLSKKVTKLHLTWINCLPLSVIEIIINSMKELSFINFSETKLFLFSVLRFARIPSMTIMYLDDCLPDSSLKSTGFKMVKFLTPTNTLSWNVCIEELNDDEELIFHNENPF